MEFEKLRKILNLPDGLNSWRFFLHLSHHLQQSSFVSRFSWFFEFWSFDSCVEPLWKKSPLMIVEFFQSHHRSEMEWLWHIKRAWFQKNLNQSRFNFLSRVRAINFVLWTFLIFLIFCYHLRAVNKSKTIKRKKCHCWEIYLNSYLRKCLVWRVCFWCFRQCFGMKLKIRILHTKFIQYKLFSGHFIAHNWFWR